MVEEKEERKNMYSVRNRKEFIEYKEM